MKHKISDNSQKILERHKFNMIIKGVKGKLLILINLLEKLDAIQYNDFYFC